jgi:hypothetical protein
MLKEEFTVSACAGGSSMRDQQSSPSDNSFQIQQLQIPMAMGDQFFFFAESREEKKTMLSPDPDANNIHPVQLN